MTDIVERLRSRKGGGELLLSVMREAADEIERLRDRLEKIAKHPNTPELIRQYAEDRI